MLLLDNHIVLIRVLFMLLNSSASYLEVRNKFFNINIISECIRRGDKAGNKRRFCCVVALIMNSATESAHIECTYDDNMPFKMVCRKKV